MTIKTLEKRILNFSHENKILTKDILQELSVYLDSTYSNKNETISNNEVFKELKIKIISCFYSFEGFKIKLTSGKGLDNRIKFNELELDLLNDALLELEEDGYIYSLKNEIGLLEKAIELN